MRADRSVIPAGLYDAPTYALLCSRSPLLLPLLLDSFVLYFRRLSVESGSEWDKYASGCRVLSAHSRTLHLIQRQIEYTQRDRERSAKHRAHTQSTLTFPYTRSLLPSVCLSFCSHSEISGLAYQMIIA